MQLQKIISKKGKEHATARSNGNATVLRTHAKPANKTRRGGEELQQSLCANTFLNTATQTLRTRIEQVSENKAMFMQDHTYKD